MRQLLAMAMMSTGYVINIGNPRESDPFDDLYAPRPARESRRHRVIQLRPDPAKVYFESERPLTKRQRRRQRGKGA